MVKERTLNVTGLDEAVKSSVFCFFRGASIPSARREPLTIPLASQAQTEGTGRTTL